MIKKRFISVLVAVALAIAATTFIGGNTVAAAQDTNIFNMLAAAETDQTNTAGEKAAPADEKTDASEKAAADEKTDTGEKAATDEKATPAEEATTTADETATDADKADAAEKTDAADKADPANEKAATDEKAETTESETKAVIIDLGSGDAVFTDEEAARILETLTVLMIDNKDIFVENGLDLTADGKKDVDIEIGSTDDGKNTLTLKKAESCDLEDEVTLTVSEDAKKSVEILKLNNYADALTFQMAEPIQPELVATFVGVKKQPYKTESGEETYLDTMWLYYSDMTFVQYAILDDSLQLFSKGTYEFADGGDFYFTKTETDYGNLIINRTHKYLAGKGLSEYESSHSYDLELLDFELIYVSQNHIDAVKEAVNKDADSKEAAVATDESDSKDAVAATDQSESE